MLARIDYTLPLRLVQPVTRDCVWALLWERVAAPERWLEGVNDCEQVTLDFETKRLTRRVWWGSEPFDETVTWEELRWLRFVTHPKTGFPGSTLTLTLLSGSEAGDEENGGLLSFSYRRFVQDDERILPDGTDLAEWLTAAYRAADEEYVAKLVQALQKG